MKPSLLLLLSVQPHVVIAAVIDGGKTWKASGSTANWTSVATTADFKLIIAVARGAAVAVSKDGGKTWANRDSARNWSAVACQA